MVHLDWNLISSEATSLGQFVVVGGAVAGIWSLGKRKISPWFHDRSFLVRQLADKESQIVNLKDLLKRAEESLRISIESHEAIMQSMVIIEMRVKDLSDRLAVAEDHFKTGLTFIAKLIWSHERGEQTPAIPESLRNDVEEQLEEFEKLGVK